MPFLSRGLTCRIQSSSRKQERRYTLHSLWLFQKGKWKEGPLPPIKGWRKGGVKQLSSPGFWPFSLQAENWRFSQWRQLMVCSFMSWVLSTTVFYFLIKKWNPVAGRARKGQESRSSSKLPRHLLFSYFPLSHFLPFLAEQQGKQPQQSHVSLRFCSLIISCILASPSPLLFLP